jgi:hypothetical protein
MMIQRSKDLFWQQVLASVPILVSMIQPLWENPNHSMQAGFFH